MHDAQRISQKGETRVREFDDSCVIFSHTNYSFLGHQVIPRVEKVGRKSIARSATFRQVKSSTYVYVPSGSGQVTVNGSLYPLSRGTVIALMNYHLYQYLPDAPLDMSYCRLLNGSGCTFYNNYFPHSAYKTFLDETTPVWKFSPPALAEAESLWDKILRLQDRHDADAVEQQLYLMMEFIGRLYQASPVFEL